MGKIMLNSNDAIADKNDLAQSRHSLVEAQQLLIKLRDGMPATWQGFAAGGCYALTDDFITKIELLLTRNLNAMKMIDIIWETYKDVDTALSGGM